MEKIIVVYDRRDTLMDYEVKVYKGTYKYVNL
jgi:hypothetical protein